NSIVLVLLDRSYFWLQAEFARRVAKVENIPLGEAFRLHTAFYALPRDNDAGVSPERNDFDPMNPACAAFTDAIARGVDPVGYVYDDYVKGDGQGDVEDRCFAFRFWPEDRLVRLHFTNNSAGDALRSEGFEARRLELQQIFQVVARDHPN